MDLGCGRGQGKKDRNNRIHGIIYLQNLRSRSDQRNDHTLQVARKFLMLAERALDSDVNPLRCRERAARAFYREPLAIPRICFPWEGSWCLAWSRFRRKWCKNSGRHLRRSVINVDTITKL